MRAKATMNGIDLKAYAGTTGVLLAMNVTPGRRTGLLGFAIEREGPGSRHAWLQGLLRFPGQAGDTLSPIDSNQAPIQKFRWSDYAVYPATAYRYQVHGVYGSPEQLRLEPGGEVSVQTEPLHCGLHQVIFNRAAAASQAYSRRFGNINPDNPPHQPARNWLSRGLREKLLSFVERASGAGWALDMAIYEIELPEIVELLQQARERGVEVRVVYHARPGDEQTRVNEQYLQALPGPVKAGRQTKALCHQKFIVLSQFSAAGGRSPVAVLTGSANFTTNGVYRQANVVHVVEDPALAQTYLDLFDRLYGGADPAQTKKYLNKYNPIVEAPRQAIFSPRSKLGDLEEVAAILHAACSEVVFCTTFDLHAKVEQALMPAQPDGVIRYGLQNSRSKITGVHRHGTFVAKAFLKKGLEGFLRESTVGQKGNILIHLKAIVTDFSGDEPVVLTGSNNFSFSASSKNDENLLIVRGEPAVADTYLCEMMRLYDHYRFRFNQTSSSGTDAADRLELVPNDTWTDRYFKPDSLAALERIRFST